MDNVVRRIDYICDRDGSVEGFLRSRGYSTRICSLLKKELGLVSVDGEPVFVISPIKRGQRLTVYICEEPQHIQPYDKPVDIVYEDEDIAVIDKTPDIAVVATNAHYNRSLMNALACVWGDYVYHPVNRLDHGTSGLMAVAKHSLAHSLLSHAIKGDKDSEEKAVRREYTAIVHNFGSRLEGVGDIVADIGQPSMDSMARGVVSSGGKYARTHYEVLESDEKYSIVRLVLATGRTHQIRVHMSHIGHPLVGDDMYGGERGVIDRPALHSSRITFTQPITGELIDISSEVASDMRLAIDRLKGK